MKLVDFFSRIYALNLPSRPDRLKMILEEFEKWEIPLVPGKVEVYPAIRPESAAGFENIGVRGVFLSQLSMIKKAYEDKCENLLIMEDDLRINPIFAELESKILTQLQQNNWGFVYFSYRIPPIKFSQDILQTYDEDIVTACFFGINGHVFGPLIEYLEQVLKRPAGHPDGGLMAIDGGYNHFRRQNPNVVTYLANPCLGSQKSSRSDIAPNKWFDKAPVVKDVVAFLRNLKLKFR